MKKLILVCLALALIFTSAPAFCAKGGKKGASQMAMEKASDKAVFHRVSDWFATVGKSKEEKDKIIAERDAKRAQERARKEAEKRVREAKEKAGKVETEAKKVKEQVRQKQQTQVMEKTRTEMKTNTQMMMQGASGKGK